MGEPCHRCREEAEVGRIECRYCWSDLADLIRGSRTETSVLTTAGSDKPPAWAREPIPSMSSCGLGMLPMGSVGRHALTLRLGEREPSVLEAHRLI